MRYKRARQTAGLWLLFGAVAGIVGLFGFLMARRHVLEAEAAQRAEEHAKPITAAQTSPKAAKSQPVATRPVERSDDWRAEAEADFREVMERRGQATKDFSAQLGRMNYGELVSATNCLREVQSSGLEGFAGVRPEVADEAAKIAPNLIAAYRRELAIELGALPEYYPLAKRKELWREYGPAVGWGDFCVTHQFNDLPAAEVDKVMQAIRRLNPDGLKALTSEERRLLLRAGALPLFKRELGL